METPITPGTPVRASQHPLMIVAAVAVVLFCAVGIAAILGWLPSSVGAGNTSSASAPRGDLSEADRNMLAGKMDSNMPMQQPAPLLASNMNGAASRSGSNGGDAGQQQGAAGDADYRPDQVAAAAPAKNWCNHCGNVESVREINTRAQGSGVGAAGGAILGGLLGNQVGSGHGRQLATVAGAVGGAVVGNQVEGNMKATHSYEIRVRMDDGGTRTFHQQNAPGWSAGSRVKVVNGSLHSVN
ncbi:glycine zipper 2TM domain-containing protein [Massilia sp. PWRC2]|uniref:glycine zipper 2TM domain-containing protein n=1 Tax=Massilia sp. PWRC2 TaxID=2804626 RepID=UPI003CFB680A